MNKRGYTYEIPLIFFRESTDFWDRMYDELTWEWTGKEAEAHQPRPLDRDTCAPLSPQR